MSEISTATYVQSEFNQYENDDVKSDVLVDAISIIPDKVPAKDVRPRKDGRITHEFTFNEENVTRGRYEQFEGLMWFSTALYKSLQRKAFRGIQKSYLTPRQK